jgi:hypothetical protein
LYQKPMFLSTLVSSAPRATPGSWLNEYINE